MDYRNAEQVKSNESSEADAITRDLDEILNKRISRALMRIDDLEKKMTEIKEIVDKIYFRNKKITPFEQISRCYQ